MKIQCKKCKTQYSYSDEKKKYFPCPNCGSLVVSDEINKELETKQKEVSKENIDQLLKEERKLLDIAKSHLKEAGKYIPFLIAVLRSSVIAVSAKATAFAALAYVLSPIDLIPDFVPGIGFLDDIAVVMTAISLLLTSASVKNLYNKMFKEKRLLNSHTLLYYFMENDSMIEYNLEFSMDTTLWIIKYSDIGTYNVKAINNKILKPNVLYLAHPFYHKILVPYEEYDKIILEERMNEMFRILQALGAKKMSYLKEDYEYKHTKGKSYAEILIEIDKEESKIDKSKTNEKQTDGTAPISGEEAVCERETEEKALNVFWNSIHVTKQVYKGRRKFPEPSTFSTKVFAELTWYFYDEINRLSIEDFLESNQMKSFSDSFSYQMTTVYNGKLNLNMKL